jgi:hypothetical protein
MREADGQRVYGIVRGGILAAAFAAFLAGAPAALATDSGNLLQNPGAESDVGSASGNDDIDVTGWTDKGGFTAVVYGASGFPGTDVATVIGGGANFFAGGQNTAKSSATQKVRVPKAFQPAVDAGDAVATLSGYLGGYSTQDDNAVVSATMRDANGTKLRSIKIGPVLAADRGGTTGLLFRTRGASVPAGTRTIVVKQTMTRTAGSFDDGYTDNLSLSLATP